MTNKEAIKIISQMIKDEKGFLSDNTVEAHKMAIKALEQEPCEDAISRKALISHIEMQSREWGEDYDAQQILGDIEDMPSVNPTKTGHWIDIDGGVECDKCGKWYPHAPIAKNEIKFCSECGARMVEPQESEE